MVHIGYRCGSLRKSPASVWTSGQYHSPYTNQMRFVIYITIIIVCFITPYLFISFRIIDSFTKSAISMEVQCISKNKLKANGWSTKPCHYPYLDSDSINYHCNLKQETSQYNLLNTNGIHQNSNDISTMLTNHSYIKRSLIDAIRCVYAEMKIEQAEMIINNLIEKFAEPSDMYTSVENLPNDNLLFCNIHNTSNGDNKKSLPNEKSLSNPSHTSVSLFSPIFKLLLTQSESQIFPDLYKLSPSGRKLLDLCHRLAFDIRRTKNKATYIAKNANQTIESTSLVRITSTNPNTTTTTDTTNISTHNTTNNVLSNFQKFLNLDKSDSLNNSIKISQDNRRNAFIHYLHDISRNYEIPTSTLTTTTKTTISNHDDPEKYGNYLEQIITSNSINPPPTTNNNINHHCTAPTYTNPLNCPLSLLSFVSNLNKVSNMEKITDDDSENKKGGEETEGVKVNEKFRQNKQKFSSLSNNNGNNHNGKKRDCETLSIPFSSFVSSLSSLSPSLPSISLSTTNNNNNHSLNLKHDRITKSTGTYNVNMANVSTMSMNDLTTNKSNTNDLPSKLPSSICSAYYSNKYHPVKSSCSLNVPSLSPSTLSSLCSTSSSNQISTTIIPSSHIHQDNSYRGKRRQVSSPSEEHNKLNNDNDFIQTPSKNRRCSSFNSQKCLTNKQFTESITNNNDNSSGKYYYSFVIMYKISHFNIRRGFVEILVFS
ncbi:LOW QUALITY PROTEIN: Dentin sialoprotein (DSP)], putative [Schistosoma mansoni]|uniref:Dentin sialoprotein (DSP)], putative n=1 Tax=Schistosoma mansoni TaxID=6183 RepID=UPI00022C8167|nr:LOW QUALITY PROTEIN: Dentin sialoprotein (DSP)], putative [Schistosoma mansoni]|eukprot:XP_018647105.1 LOW QUALITY PROTEIN: Dentin sialoprotein (DSP)], putative [Schistosoma mansoni]